MTHRCFAPMGCTSPGEWEIQPLWLVLQKAFPGSSNCKWIAFRTCHTGDVCACERVCLGVVKNGVQQNGPKWLFQSKFIQFKTSKKNLFHVFPHQCSMIFRPRCTASNTCSVLVLSESSPGASKDQAPVAQSGAPQRSPLHFGRAVCSAQQRRCR